MEIKDRIFIYKSDLIKYYAAALILLFNELMFIQKGVVTFKIFTPRCLHLSFIFKDAHAVI